MDEPLGLIRRTDETRDMNLYELIINGLNERLKEKNAEIERLHSAIRCVVDESGGSSSCSGNGEDWDCGYDEGYQRCAEYLRELVYGGKGKEE